jgi:Mrp family chromosome partitioning ATPase
MSLHDPFSFTRIGLELMTHLERHAPAGVDDDGDADGHARATGPSGRVVMISSTRPGEGRTFVSQGLARALSEQQGGDVVWVDAAFDAPAGEEDPSRRGAAGLSEIMTLGALHGLAPAARQPGRLWRLGRGVLAQRSLLYQPAAVHQGLFALRAGFAFTVLDAPCLEACGALLSQVDACLLVVDARSTPRHAAQHAIAQARFAPGRFAGIVLNHRPRPLPRWLGGE